MAKNRNLQILYIEDSRVDAMFLQQEFADLKGVELTIATNLFEAHKIGPCDIILLDLMLSASDPEHQTLGVDTVKKARHGFPDKPIVVLTHVDDPQMQSTCIAAGANYYFRKGEQDVRVIVRAMEAAIIAHANRLAVEDELSRTKRYAVPLEQLIVDMLENIREIKAKLGDNI